MHICDLEGNSFYIVSSLNCLPKTLSVLCLNLESSATRMHLWQQTSRFQRQINLITVIGAPQTREFTFLLVNAIPVWTLKLHSSFSAHAGCTALAFKSKPQNSTILHRFMVGVTPVCQKFGVQTCSSDYLWRWERAWWRWESGVLGVSCTVSLYHGLSGVLRVLLPLIESRYSLVLNYSP